MLLAETYFVQGNTKAMIESVRRALDLSNRFDYEYWLRREIRRNPAIFGHEDIADRLPVDLREELSAERSVRPARVQSQLEPPAPITDLTIRVLGPVEIFRDPSVQFADAWTTRRARDIFCYIATSKNRRVLKEVLIEAFWPDEDLETVERIFIRRSRISEKRSTVVSLSSRTFLSFATARISSIPSFHIPSTPKNSSSGSSKRKKQNARKTRRSNGRVSNPLTRSTGGIHVRRL